MKRLTALVFAITIVAFTAGCSSLRNIDAASAIGAAASIEKGDYFGALQHVGKLLDKRKQLDDQIAKTMTDAGFTFTRTLFYEDRVVNDHSKVAWKDEWSKLLNAAKDDIAAVAPMPSNKDELREEIGAILDAAGITE